MKSKQWCLIMIFYLLLISPMAVQAGSINGPESSLIAAAQAVFNYDGKDYVAADWCIGALYSKLAEDGVDLSSTQVCSLIDMGYANIGRGVAEGYLIPVYGNDDTDTYEEQQTEVQTEQHTQQKEEENKTSNKNNDKNNQASSNIENNQEISPDIEEDTEKETEAVAAAESEPYIISDAIAGLGAVKEKSEKDNPEKDNWIFLKYILLQIYGLLPDIVQRMLSGYFH